METGQFLERFRLLSREIQLGIQQLEKGLDALRTDRGDMQLAKVKSIAEKIDEDWSDFSGWVLISTLEDIEEARKNCAAGLVNVKSKIHRSKIRATSQADQHGVKIDVRDVGDVEVETYIPYFEQILDLGLLNAVKYSPRGQVVSVSCSWKGERAVVSIDSFGPLILKHEKPNLGKKGFRSENAKMTDKPGDGFGLYNIFRLSELLNISVSINLSHKNIFEFGAIPYSDFSLILSIGRP